MAEPAQPAQPDQQYQYVKLPDGSYGKFASNATDEFIHQQVTKDFPDAYRSDQAPASSRYWQGVQQGRPDLNQTPSQQLSGMTEHGYRLLTHPIDTLRQDFRASPVGQMVSGDVAGGLGRMTPTGIMALLSAGIPNTEGMLPRSRITAPVRVAARGANTAIENAPTILGTVGGLGGFAAGVERGNPLEATLAGTTGAVGGARLGRAIQKNVTPFNENYGLPMTTKGAVPANQFSFSQRPTGPIEQTAQPLPEPGPSVRSTTRPDLPAAPARPAPPTKQQFSFGQRPVGPVQGEISQGPILATRPEVNVPPARVAVPTEEQFSFGQRPAGAVQGEAGEPLPSTRPEANIPPPRPPAGLTEQQFSFGQRPAGPVQGEAETPLPTTRPEANVPLRPPTGPTEQQFSFGQRPAGPVQGQAPETPLPTTRPEANIPPVQSGPTEQGFSFGQRPVGPVQGEPLPGKPMTSTRPETIVRPPLPATEPGLPVPQFKGLDFTPSTRAQLPDVASPQWRLQETQGEAALRNELEANYGTEAESPTSFDEWIDSKRIPRDSFASDAETEANAEKWDQGGEEMKAKLAARQKLLDQYHDEVPLSEPKYSSRFMQGLQNAISTKVPISRWGRAITSEQARAFEARNNPAVPKGVLAGVKWPK